MKLPPGMKDPADTLAETYFDCSSRAAEADASGQRKDAIQYRKTADRAKRVLAQYGMLERYGIQP